MSITLRAKRILTGALAGALVLGLLPAGVASANTDVCDGATSGAFPDSASATHQGNIDCIAAYEIIQGRADGTFGGSASITRGQFATMIAKFAEVASGTALAIEATPFTDIAGHTHADNIARLYGAEITSGKTATTFAPNATISRQEAATLIKQAHDALGVDFSGVTPATNFTDVSGTHAANINLLAGAGVISGKSATTFGPTMSISRQETATLLVRSANQVLVEQNLWSADPLTTPVASANIITEVAGSTFKYSDGTKVSDTITVGTNDVLFVDGVAQNKTNFDAALSVGDEVTVEKDTPAKDRQTIRLTNRAASYYTSGVIGVPDLTGNTLNIIEPVSGNTLRAITTVNAALSTYTVDGTAATLTQFRANWNTGDEIVVSGAGTTASPWKFALTNKTVTGTISENTAANAANGNLKAKSSSGYIVNVQIIDTDDSITVAGKVITGADGDAKKTSLDTEIGTGTPGTTRTQDTITYARAGGIQTITVTHVKLAAKSGVVQTPLKGLPTAIAGPDGAAVAIAVNTVNDTNYTFTVDGAAATAAAFTAAVTAGDSITIQEVDGKALTGKGTIALTNSSLTGKVVDTSATVLAVELASTTTTKKKTDTIAYTGVDSDLYGNVDPSQYRVNGVTRTQAQFVAAVALVTDGTNTATITVSDAGTYTLFDMTVTAAAAATFTVNAVTSGVATTSIDITFSQPIRYETGVFAASDFVLKGVVGGNTVTIAVDGTDLAVSPTAHGTGTVDGKVVELTIASTTFDAGTVSVELTATGAAKMQDKNGNAPAAATKTVVAAP